MKVQIYRSTQSTDKEEQGLIVQFRRKKDDVVAFNHIFKKVSSELQEHAKGLQVGIRAPDSVVPNYRQLDPPDPPALSTPPIETQMGSDVQPLLDMFFNSALPTGQVEAMIGLAQILSIANFALTSVIMNALTKPGVYQQLQELGASPEFEVNYPANLLVSQINSHSGGNGTTML